MTDRNNFRIIDLGKRFEEIPNPLNPRQCFGRYQLWGFSGSKSFVVQTSDKLGDLQNKESSILVITVEQIGKLNQ